MDTIDVNYSARLLMDAEVRTTGIVHAIGQHSEILKTGKEHVEK